MSERTFHPVTLTDENFDAEVLQSDIPVLVDFWAEWCGPCRTLGPTIDALTNDFAGRAKIGKLDVDSNQIASQYGIRSIPTVILFANGEARKQWVGVQAKNAYAEGLHESLSDAEAIV